MIGQSLLAVQILSTPNRMEHILNYDQSEYLPTVTSTGFKLSKLKLCESVYIFFSTFFIPLTNIKYNQRLKYCITSDFCGENDKLPWFSSLKKPPQNSWLYCWSCIHNVYVLEDKWPVGCPFHIQQQYNVTEEPMWWVHGIYRLWLYWRVKVDLYRIQDCKCIINVVTDNTSLLLKKKTLFKRLNKSVAQLFLWLLKYEYDRQICVNGVCESLSLGVRYNIYTTF